MIEFVTTVFITVSSVLLFGYWFRYTCLLILSAKTTRDFAGEVVMANQLGFLEVQAQLRTSAGNLDTLRLVDLNATDAQLRCMPYDGAYVARLILAG